MKAEDLLIPDERWTIWNCHSFQEYLDRFFIPGKFHTGVPQKVKEAYLSVERLLAYSYYFYPLTEEVHSKMTRIFEMAVREKASIHGIEFKKENPSLKEHCDAFEKHEVCNKNLLNEIRDIVNLRNIYAHPKNHNYSGPIALISIIRILNLINHLFLSKVTYQEYVCKAEALESLSCPYNKGEFIFETQEKVFLISGAHPLALSKDELRSLWILYPVTKTSFKPLEDFEYVKPFFLRLSNFKITDGYISGYDLNRNSEIKIIPLTIDKCIHDELFPKNTTVDLRAKATQDLLISCEIDEEINRFIYEEYWE